MGGKVHSEISFGRDEMDLFDIWSRFHHFHGWANVKEFLKCFSSFGFGAIVKGGNQDRGRIRPGGTSNTHSQSAIWRCVFPVSFNGVQDRRDLVWCIDGNSGPYIALIVSLKNEFSNDSKI